MGFDVKGVNPKINTKDDEFPLLEKYNWNNFDNFQDKYKAMEENNEKDEYWEQYEAHQAANPGVYFRNNVWWWRPLWDFVCNNCQDILSKEDMENGSFNNGYEINESKSNKIAKRLYILLEDKTVDDYELAYEEFRKNKKESGDEEDSFLGNYPFCRDNIARFAKFCEESGGFIIC